MANQDTPPIAPRQGPMHIHLKALDEQGKLYFEGSFSLEPLVLIEMAKSREDLARAKGRAFTEGNVPFLGAELLKAAQQGKSEDQLQRRSIEVAMAAWLADSIYGGVSAAEFVHSNLHFTFLANGAVRYDRIRIG